MEKQIKTIKYEMRYYSNYCDPSLKDKINKFLDVKTDLELFEIINSLLRSDINDLLLYFYLHTSIDGEVISLNHSIQTNSFVSENKDLFIEIDNKFINNLFNNNKPLYFFDVDNTLTDRGFLSTEKIDFIKKFKYRDNVILSTGKVSDAIMNVIDDCSLNDNYFSCLNGSVVHKNDDYILMNGVGNVSKEIMEKLMDTDITFIFYYYDCIKVIKPLLQKDIDNLNKFNEKFEYCNEEIKYNEIVKVLAFIDDDKTQESIDKENVVRGIVKNYSDLHCVRTAPHTFEVLRKDQHKGNSVRKISELMGKYYRLSIGVGDSMNDLPMLEYIGVPYVVSNVSTELAEYNFEILEGSRDVDIVNILKKYGD